MNNNNNTTTINAQVFSALLIAGISKVADTGDLAINFGFAPENVQIFGSRFDGGQSNAVLRAIKHGIAGTYNRVEDGALYLSNGFTSLADFKASKIVSVGGDYAVGGDYIRNLVANGKLMYSDVVVDGAVYRLIQEGKATKMHRLTAVKQEGVKMHPNAEWDANARTLVEGMDLLFMAWERGMNVLVKANKVGWKVDQICEWLATGDAKAAIAKHTADGKEAGEFNDSIERGLYVGNHAEEYTKSYTKIVETVKVVKNVTGTDGEALLGKTINYYRSSDVSKTPIVKSVGEGKKIGKYIDSVELANSYIVTCANNSMVLFVVE